MKPKIAVIGAGVAGLGAASLLHQAGFRVNIFEKSRGVSGRAASRSRDGCRYDHGANYFTAEDDEVREWISEKLCPDDLVGIDGPVLPFDRHGIVGEADGNRGKQLRYTYRGGISAIGKNMRQAFKLEVAQGVRIQSLHSGDAGWLLADDSGLRSEAFDAVLVTAPLPQAVQLIENSLLKRGLTVELLSAFSSVRYFCQYSVVLNFYGLRKLPGDAFALINSDRKHPISWISNEGFKSGHVPEHQSLFVVQMSAQWSSQHERSDKADVAQQAFVQVADLLDDKLPSPRWSDVQWWRFAHPEPAGAITSPPSASAAGLYFAGDGFVGKGRVEGALKSGFTTAREIVRNFKRQ